MLFLQGFFWNVYQYSFQSPLKGLNLHLHPPYRAITAYLITLTAQVPRVGSVVVVGLHSSNI